MSGPTNRQEKAMLDAALDIPNQYLGLFTTMPADDGTGGVEVSGGSYARVNLGATGNAWSPAVAGAPTTKSGPSGTGSPASWTFPAPTADWGYVVGFGIFDAATGGNLNWIGDLGIPRNIVSGDPAPVFNATHQIMVQLGDVGDTFQHARRFHHQELLMWW